MGATEHLYLTFDCCEGVDPRDAIEKLAAFANPLSTDGINVVVGVRPSLWEQVSDARYVPEGYHDFTDDKGTGPLCMPADQHDFWLWIAGSGMDVCWDWGKVVIEGFSGVATIATEHRGWTYHGNQDLTGFVDGTENPRRLLAPSIVGVDRGKPGEDSCICLFQPYEHTEFTWYQSNVDEQERAIGRTKLENRELKGDDRPDTSHVSRTDIDVKIWRRNVAYGDMRYHGTLFVGFADEQWKMEDMLDRMTGADGVHDAIMDFMHVTGSGWYTVPSNEGLVQFL